jgi:hypothetical protein
MGKAVELVRSFFNEASKNDHENLLSRNNHTFQFNLDDAEPFFVSIKNGKVEVCAGDAGDNFREVYRIGGTFEGLQQVIENRVRFSDAMFDSKLRAQEVGKRPLLTWFIKLVRIGQKRIKWEEF